VGNILPLLPKHEQNSCVDNKVLGYDNSSKTVDTDKERKKNEENCRIYKNSL
jgi:hypothetical protein